jgi:uncharacterized protein (UPF0332 family)
LTPESRAWLNKAHSDLDEAAKIAAIGLARAAARSACFAAFHAAQALIVERSGKTAKTHSGVRAKFAEIARSESQLDRTFSTFLAQSYKYKEIGDYGIGPEAAITSADAADAIARATRFVEGIEKLL